MHNLIAKKRSNKGLSGAYYVKDFGKHSSLRKEGLATIRIVNTTCVAANVCKLFQLLNVLGTLCP